MQNSKLPGSVTPARKFLLVAGLAILPLGFYLWLAYRYPIAPNLQHPRGSWMSQVGATPWNLIQHLAVYLAVGLLFFGLLLALRKYRQELAGWQRWVVLMLLAAWLACSLAMLPVTPNGESHDIFDYIVRGRMMAEYRLNPLVYTPATLGYAVPYYSYAAWYKSVDAYGPLWNLASFAVSGGVRWLAQRMDWWQPGYLGCPYSPLSCRLLIVYVEAYRLLEIGMTGLSGWLVARIVAARDKQLVPLALAGWLLNPLMLISSALGGHNDSMLLALFLLAVFLLLRKRPFWSLLVLILAAHVKLTALIWLPAFGLWIFWRWGWKQALKISSAAAAVSVLLSWILYAPFGGWSSLPRQLHDRTLYLGNSIWQVLNYICSHYWKWPGPITSFLSRNLPLILFAIAAGLALLWLFNLRPRRWRRDAIAPAEAETRLLQALVVTSLLFIGVASFWFQPWYITWVIAPAVLLPESDLSHFLLPWLAFGAIASNITADIHLAPLWGSLSQVGVIWGPFLAAGLVLLLVRRRSRPRPIDRA
ncbi:MAG: glycosyltransferase 87 family protein [Anaerolineales bacterium]